MKAGFERSTAHRIHEARDLLQQHQVDGVVEDQGNMGHVSHNHMQRWDATVDAIPRMQQEHARRRNAMHGGGTREVDAALER